MATFTGTGEGSNGITVEIDGKPITSTPVSITVA
jgi:hypothetical protein